MARSLIKIPLKKLPISKMLIGFCSFLQVFNFQVGFAAEPLMHPFLQDEVTEADSAVEVQPEKASPLSFELQLKNTVEIARDRIYLSDLAVCTNITRGCDEAMALDFGPAPPPGRTSRLTKTGVAALIHREWPETNTKISGGELITVSAPAAEVDKLAIQKALNETLQDIFSDSDGMRVRIDRMQLLSSGKVRPGVFRYEFPEIVESSEDIISRLTRNNGGAISSDVVLTSEAVQSPEQRISLSVVVVVERLIVVAAADINAGSILKEKDLKLDWVLARSQGLRGFASFEPVVGKKAKRNIFLNTAVEGTSVESVSLIGRGEIVGMLVRGGGVEVNARVEALAAGSAGDTIEVLNRESKKKMRALVVAKNQVEAL